MPLQGFVCRYTGMRERSRGGEAVKQDLKGLVLLALVGKQATLATEAQAVFTTVDVPISDLAAERLS